MSVATFLRRPIVLVLIVLALVGVVVALWLSALVGGILIASAAVTAVMLVLPSMFAIAVHGPGYQYREDRDRRRNRS